MRRQRNPLGWREGGGGREGGESHICTLFMAFWPFESVVYYWAVAIKKLPSSSSSVHDLCTDTHLYRV